MAEPSKPSMLGRFVGRIRPGSSATGAFSQVTTTGQALAKATAAGLRQVRDGAESWLGQSWPFISSVRRASNGRPTGAAGIHTLSDLMIMDADGEDFERDADGRYTGRMAPYEADDPRVLKKIFGIEVGYID